MLSAWVKNLFRTPAQQPPATPEPPHVPAADRAPLRYPPSDPGLPVLTADLAVQSADDIVQRLRTHAATSEKIFNLRFLGPVTRLADYISVIPATSTGLFSGELGLFRACIETAFYGYQASDGRIFSGSAGVEKRHTLEGRWRYLCFAAGLLYPIGRTLEGVVVTDQSGQSWPRHTSGGIVPWAQHRHAERLYVSWPNAATEDIGPSNAALQILPSVIGAENLQFLEDGDAELVSCLFALAAGQPAAPIAQDVVKGAWERIRRREAARRPLAFGRLVAGTHVGPYLVGAIRALIDGGKWKINESPLRADIDGLYVLWPEAARDVINHGRSEGLQGWPAEPATLAQLLAAAGIVERPPLDAGFVELVDLDSGEVRQALKIANPLAVLEDFDPEDYRVAQTVAGLASQDPLASAEPSEMPPPQVPAQPQPAAAVAQRIAPALPPEPAAALPTATPSTVGATADQRAEPRESEGKLREGVEVRFEELVPPELRRSIGDQLHVECLGKLVHLWKGGGQDRVMRRTDNGLVIAWTTVAQAMRNPFKWLESMSKAGLLYVPPGKDGLKVDKFRFGDSDKDKVDAIVLSRLACSKLGI